MRFSFALAALLASLNVVEAFVPSQNVARRGQQVTPRVFSTVEADTEASAVETPETPESNGVAAPSGDVPSVSAADIKSKLESQLEKLREKDSKSPKLSKEVSIFQMERGPCGETL